MTVLSGFRQQKQTDRRCEKKVKFYYTSGDAKKLARATTYKVSFQHGYMFFFFCLRQEIQEIHYERKVACFQALEHEIQKVVMA